MRSPLPPTPREAFAAACHAPAFALTNAILLAVRGEAAHGMIDAAAGRRTMGGSGTGCVSRNVCTCDAMRCRAMPCPCHARQQRFYVLLRIAPISLWKFPFSSLSSSYSSASCCPNNTRDHEEFSTSTASTLTLPIPGTDLPAPSTCTVPFTAKDRRPSRGLNDGSTQRPCLGFPPLCPDCSPWGNLTRIPARGQEPL